MQLLGAILILFKLATIKNAGFNVIDTGFKYL